MYINTYLCIYMLYVNICTMCVNVNLYMHMSCANANTNAYASTSIECCARHTVARDWVPNVAATGPAARGRGSALAPDLSVAEHLDWVILVCHHFRDFSVNFSDFQVKPVKPW